MAAETFYSALHWAKKAEASAKLAADLAQTEGKVIQLGFDGSMQDGQLVFKHAPGGVEVPYQLVDDVEYELDLAYTELSELPSATQMIVKNGDDTITFVSAEHRSSTEPATVGDMKAVMRYNSDTGYRWLFKAAYKITPAGTKVLLLYPVVASEEAVNSKITNCITEIPQDIKLELTDGVLTLKAGSKVYVPNGKSVDGSNKFDEVVIESDVVRDLSGETLVDSVTYVPATNALSVVPLTRVSSGTTTPSDTSYMFYNTSTNLIYDQANNYRSFPIAIFNGGTQSIDQVFNGFGYIGSTVFALPGVKGLIPNGRNADGSLRNEEFTTSIVRTIGYPGTSYSNYKLALADTSLGIYIPNRLEYQEDVNKNYNNNTSRYELLINAGYVSSDGSTITSFTPKLPFRAADMNDVDSKIASSLPTGTILPYGGSAAPSGFLLCNGSTISRTTYANLFKAIGTTYGAGDGSTTFTLPNYGSARMVTSATVGVKGNGKTLGLTNGTAYGLTFNTTNAYALRPSSSPTANIGASVSEAKPTSSIAIGVNTDSSKSGLTGSASLASSCKFIIKY